MPGWEDFASCFGNKQSKRDRYIQQRPRAADPLAEVELILLARGTGDLPAGSLDDIETNHGLLQGRLNLADGQLDRNKTAALRALLELIRPSQELLAEAVEARGAAERRERLRREDERVLVERIERDLVLIENIESHTGVVPGAGATIRREQARWRQMAREGKGVIALGQLQGADGPLDRLEVLAVDLAFLRKRVPSGLEQPDQKKVDDWDTAIVEALEAGTPEPGEEAMVGLRKFVMTSTLVKETEQIIGGRSPDERMDGLRLRIQDIVEFPKEFASPAVKENRKAVKKLVEDIGQRSVRVTLVQGLLDLGIQTPRDREDLKLSLAMALAEAHSVIDQLEKKLEEAARVQGEHNTAMRSYYAQIKKLKPRVAMARACPAQKTGVDTPWKAEREEFDRRLQAVQDDVADPKHDYAAALLKLPALVTAIDALGKKRAQELQTGIDGATDPTSGSARKALGVVMEIAKTPGLIAELAPEQQLKLLEGLRNNLYFCPVADEGFTKKDFKAQGRTCPVCMDGDVDHVQIPSYCSDNACRKPGTWTSSNPCPDCGNDDFALSDAMDTGFFKNGEEHPNHGLVAARATILSQMRLTPEFEQWDKQKRTETIESIRSDPAFAEAETNWKTWVTSGDTAKIEAYLNSVIRRQCQILGHDQSGLTRKDSDTGLDVDFPDVPVKIKLVTPVPPKPGEYGACLPGFPTWIEMNTTCRQFDDFKEIVDTIVHENAHAFQEMLIRKAKARAPFSGTDRTNLLSDPALGMQAKLFLENDVEYVNGEEFDDGSSQSLVTLANRAYRHEPLEEHAWGVGGHVSRALLVPPPVESFESKKVLRSKTWMVEHVTREARAKVKLKERHGVYVDEWEGERASDKKLILEGLLKGGARKTKEVRIRTVVDAFTLMLELDTSAWDAHGTDGTKVAGDGARLRLDERVSDL